VLHVSTRSCHQAYKAMYKEADCTSLHLSLHRLRSHPYNHITFLLIVLNSYIIVAWPIITNPWENSATKEIIAIGGEEWLPLCQRVKRIRQQEYIICCYWRSNYKLWTKGLRQWLVERKMLTYWAAWQKYRSVMRSFRQLGVKHSCVSCQVSLSVASNHTARYITHPVTPHFLKIHFNIILLRCYDSYKYKPLFSKMNNRPYFLKVRFNVILAGFFKVLHIQATSLLN
jgi:hypothetical protein